MKFIVGMTADVEDVFELVKILGPLETVPNLKVVSIVPRPDSATVAPPGVLGAVQPGGVTTMRPLPPQPPQPPTPSGAG